MHENDYCEPKPTVNRRLRISELRDMSEEQFGRQREIQDKLEAERAE